MKHLFYTSSHSAWQGFMAGVRSAQTSIYMEMYIFVDDVKETNDLIKLFVEKAKAGVSVKIVLDAFGSKDLSSDAATRLKESGVELLFFRKFFRRLHRKIVIVDEKVGFIGGVNIHKSARMWMDLIVRVEGPIVYSLVYSFGKVYRICGGEDLHILNYKKKAILGRTRIWLLEHLPSIHRPRLKDSYKELIVGAKDFIVISTPYFMPHKWLQKILLGAKNRGVEVKIFVPKNTDFKFITKANYTYMRRLGQLGIKFYVNPKMNHSKLLLIDDRLALVGSQNIDSLSFDYNIESGLFFDDTNMIRDLKKIVDNWEKDAELFDAHEKTTLFDRALSYVVRMLQPFL